MALDALTNSWHVSGAETTTGTGPAVPTQYGTNRAAEYVQIDVSAWDGLTSVVFWLSGCNTIDGTYTTQGPENVEGIVTGTGRYSIPYQDDWNFHKLNWTIVGAGSVTFSAESAQGRP